MPCCFLVGFWPLIWFRDCGHDDEMLVHQVSSSVIKCHGLSLASPVCSLRSQLSNLHLALLT